MDREQDSLAARLKAGEHDAATELIDTYYRQIFWFMRRFGYDRQRSEDLTQECFMQAWQHISQLRHAQALSGWLFRIAVNVARGYRRRYQEKEPDIDQIRLQGENETEPEYVERLEQQKLLKNAVLGLSVKLKETIVLHYLQQLSISEAAEAAGISQGTFKSRLNRALKILRRQFEIKG